MYLTKFRFVCTIINELFFLALFFHHVSIFPNTNKDIFDPYNDCTEVEGESSEKVLTDLIVNYRQYSAKWKGLCGTNYVPRFIRSHFYFVVV